MSRVSVSLEYWDWVEIQYLLEKLIKASNWREHPSNFYRRELQELDEFNKTINFYLRESKRESKKRDRDISRKLYNKAERKERW